MPVVSPANKIFENLRKVRTEAQKAIKDFFRHSPPGTYYLEDGVQGVCPHSDDTLEDINSFTLSKRRVVSIVSEDNAGNETELPIDEFHNAEGLLRLLFELEAKKYTYSPFK